MVLKLKYQGLILVVVFFLFSCNHQAVRKEKTTISAYQNLSRQPEKPVSTMPLAASQLVVSEQKRPIIPKPKPTLILKPAIDTLTPGEVKTISAKPGLSKLGENRQKPTEVKNPSVPTMFRVRFDNDIFDNTDYYYTNGIQLSLYTAVAGRSPFSRLLIKAKNGILLQGFSLTQNIYTPTVPEAENISYGDYPFSGFLAISQFSESYNLHRKLIVKSSIGLGVLGPASMSGTVQASVHEKEPVGWKYQIANSPVIHYSLSVEKGVYSSRHFEWNMTGKVEVGTLFDDIQTGTYLRAGRFTQVLRGYQFPASNGFRRDFQFWFFLKGNLKLVGYNATLQGGMFNDKSPYVIPATQVSRLVAETSAGVALYYGNFGVELENIYNSPEFKGAYDFRYGRISLLFGF